MLFEIIYLGVTINYLLESTHADDAIRRTSDFSKEYNNDIFNDLESPMIDSETSVLGSESPTVAMIVLNERSPNTMSNKIEKNNLIDDNENTIGLKETLSVDPITESKGNVPHEIQMGEDASSSEIDSDSRESFGLDVANRDNVDDKKDDMDKSEILKDALRSCSKKAYKKCKIACKSAYKITCYEYFCSRRLKKTFRKSCKTNCMRTFS